MQIGFAPGRIRPTALVRAEALLEAGAIGILGNHDAAILGPDADVNSTARAAGQPRDGSTAAGFGILDTGRRTLSFGRVAYDHFEAARNNHVDHLIVGACGSGGVRRYLGSVSTAIVAEATCSVTVVRAGDVGQEGTA